jgi:hypothetical protein
MVSCKRGITRYFPATDVRSGVSSGSAMGALAPPPKIQMLL